MSQPSNTKDRPSDIIMQILLIALVIIIGVLVFLNVSGMVIMEIFNALIGGSLKSEQMWIFSVVISLIIFLIIFKKKGNFKSAVILQVIINGIIILVFLVIVMGFRVKAPLNLLKHYYFPGKKAVAANRNYTGSGKY